MFRRCRWSNYSELTASSLLKYEVVISEHEGFFAHGRPERGESAGKTHDPGAAGPQAPQARRGFCSALSQRFGRPCAEDPTVR